MLLTVASVAFQCINLGRFFCAKQIYKDFEFDRFLLPQHAGFMRDGTIYPGYEFHRFHRLYRTASIPASPFMSDPAGAEMRKVFRVRLGH